MNRTAAFVFAASLAGVLQAQTPISTLVTQQKTAFTNIKNNLQKAADKMPEDAYGFKPSPELQDFGQRVGHMAGMIVVCSRVKGGEPKQNMATGKTSKADLVAALKAALDECSAAWETINDTTAMETMQGGRGGPATKIGTLIGNTIHANETYGTMTVYMRLKGQVPPSSEGR